MNLYPFGLEHKGYNNVVNGTENNYKQFQGQEWTEDLGLNIHEWKYRISDPAIGRFWQVDPLAADYVYNGVYNFSENRVIDGNELEGLEWQPVNDNFENVTNGADNHTGYTWVGFNEDGSAPEGTVADGIIWNSDETGATFYEVNSKTNGPKVGYSRLTSKTISFTGAMETFPDNANKEWASGEIIMTSNFENGKTVTDDTWTAVSGPWGNGSLENGDYTSNNLRDNRTGAYQNHGIGYTFDLNPTFETGRSLLRFHPDGGDYLGTQGCIGLTCGATGLTNFRTKMNQYLTTHTNIGVNVNITNNPNNDGN